MCHSSVSNLASGLFEENKESVNSDVISIYSKIDTPKFVESMISQADFIKLRNASQNGEDDV
jgi:hypothetical protein